MPTPIEDLQPRKLKSDSTASGKGLVFQFCVALKKCFEMKSGQTVFIEKFGDVTLSNEEQIEVKHHLHSQLTDRHTNIWNTIWNWLDQSFESSRYVSLILLTTQSFSESSRLKRWNSINNIHERMELLESIYKENSSDSSPNKTTLELQKKIFTEDNRQRLIDIASKFYINADVPGLENYYEEIKQEYLKDIPELRQNDFMKALIGFIIIPDGVPTWAITYDAFKAETEKIAPTYSRYTHIFPKKHFRDMSNVRQNELDEHSKFDFVKKIEDIDYHTEVPKAISDYIFAIRTIEDEFISCEVMPDMTKQYAEELATIFKKKHNIASRRCSNAIEDSKDFYDNMTSQHHNKFGTFDDTPLDFSNGVIHIQTNSGIKNLKWRLK